MTTSKLYDDVHTAVLEAELKTHEVLTPDPEVIQFITQSRLTPKSRILDVGCGCGRNAVFLAKQGFSVTAVDVSVSAIELTKRLAKESEVSLDTMVVDVCEPGVLPAESFEAVIDARCLHNIVETYQRTIFLSNLFQSLVRGGWYFGMNIGRAEEESARGTDRGNNNARFVNVDGIEYQPIALETRNGKKEYLIRVWPVVPMWPERYQSELAEVGFVDIQVDFSFEKGRRPLPSRLLATARKIA